MTEKPEIPACLLRRKIIHVDMDAFYASIEEKDDPTLIGKPVVIGGSAESRGVVCTANYEARKYGVHSAMPTSRAKRLCPNAIFLSPRFSRYQELSKIIQNCFNKYATDIEPLSLDEAFLDVTECKLADTATEIAALIKNDIFEATGLTASAGVAPNKMLAKIASDLDKPNGVYVIKPHQVMKFLENLPVKKIPGVGPVTNSRLASFGIVTCGDVWKFDIQMLSKNLGSRLGPWLKIMASGLDERAVSRRGKSKSISTETTFAKDISDVKLMIEKLEGLSESLQRRLEKKNTKGRTITLKVRYSDFTLCTRSLSVEAETSDKSIIFETLKNLLFKTEVETRAIRLLGAGMSKFPASKSEKKEQAKQTEPIKQIKKIDELSADQEYAKVIALPKFRSAIDNSNSANDIQDNHKVLDSSKAEALQQGRSNASSANSDLIDEDLLEKISRKTTRKTKAVAKEKPRWIQPSLFRDEPELW